MKTSFVIVFICVFCNCYSQTDIDTSNNSSTVINRISYFWKLDSVGSNGYRYLAYKQLKASKVDTVSFSLLLEKLGNPNKILKNSRGIDYIYYYLDSRKLPRNFNAPLACWYISFFYEKSNSNLVSISIGSFEL